MYVCGDLITVPCVAISFRRGSVFMVAHHMYPMLNPLVAGFSRKLGMLGGWFPKAGRKARGYFSHGHELVCC